MSNVCIQLNFPSPYENPVTVETSPVFVLGPDSTAWGEWIFGGDESSLVSQVGNHTLTVNGTPPGPLQFTEKTYIPFPFPNGLVSDLVDSTSQTLIYAFKRPTSTKFIGGSSGSTPTTGKGFLFLASGTIQFTKSVGSSSTNASISAAEVAAIPGDILVAALVSDGENFYGYLKDVSSVATIPGVNTLSSERFPGIGNNYFNSSNYYTSPEYYGARFYNKPLTESEARTSMDQLYRRVTS